MFAGRQKIADCAARCRDAVQALSGRQHVLAGFVAGSLSVLAFAPVFASPVLFVTIPLFYWQLDKARSTKEAALTGWWFAFGYFFFNLFWLGEAFLVEADKFAWLLPFAITLLPAGLALFWAAGAALLHRFRLPGVAGVLTFAVIFSLVEWVRGHALTGLPWNVPGYALTAPLGLMQSAGLVGIYGLTLIALSVFAGPLVLVAERKFRAAVLIAVGPIALLAAYGAMRLSMPVETIDGVKVRIVQPSVLQTEKWRPEHQRRIFDDHLALSLTGPTGARDDLADITHVLWPEAAMPFFPLESEQALADIAAMLPLGRTLITGAIRREMASASAEAPARSTPKVFNSILVFDDLAALKATYDKIHLVPFGEYLPVEPLLAAIGLQKLTYGRGAFSAGQMPRPLFSVAGLPPILGLVCYEVLFPDEVARASGRPALVVNVTNDGWFGNTSGPRQHYHQTRVRAVEQGVQVLRAANNGISASIDPYGREVGRLDMNVRGTVDTGVLNPAPTTIYSRLGDWVFVALLAVWTALAFSFARQPAR